MIRQAGTLLAAHLLLVIAAKGQTGWRDASLPNPTSSGSATLSARIHYPSTQAGPNVPLLPRPGGYPVVVFLHGYGGLGRNYPDLGDRLAAAGFLAVLSDTAMIQPNVQRDDGIALFAALVAENAQSGSFWQGAIDMTRAAVSGHSMGGGNSVRILAANPGYRTGVLFAPWHGVGLGGGAPFAPVYGPQIATPLLILHGEGDTSLSWQLTAQSYYDHANGYTGSKAFVLLNHDCTHSNVARLPAGSTAVDVAVFERSLATAIGWLGAQLRDEADGLEAVLGPTLLAEPRLSQLQVSIREPRLWRQGAPTPGSNVDFRLSGEPGVAALAIALGPGNLTTPFGELLLDLGSTVVLNGAPIVADDLQLTAFAIPNDPTFVGLGLWLQGVAETDANGLRLTNRIEFVVTL